MSIAGATKVAFAAITSNGTLGTLVARLAVSLETRGAAQVSVSTPPNLGTVSSFAVDYPTQAKEALAALLNHLEAFDATLTTKCEQVRTALGL